ncbi:MAG: hypothetical protein DRP15_00590 [Candidatus Aenigmatarchaeota archaeon]|nr:MAG: hypothetical protein DRP15_00590 [Candidatus Aenigmarchaeota archaeon]
MIDIIFKNIMRNKTRTFLTVLGILIGIGAVVSLGSIAEGIDATVQSGLELTAGKIMVIEKDSGFFGFLGELTDEDIEVIENVGGIKDIVPVLAYVERFKSTAGYDWSAIGIDPGKTEYFVGENIEMEEGRSLEEDDTEVAVVGNDMAEKYDLHVGDTWTIQKMEFEIVGIIEKTNIQDIDTSIIVPLQDLQDALESDTFQMIYVIPEDLRDTEIIAENIKEASDRLDTLTTKEFARQASEIVERIRFFTMGIGAIAAVVGGLGVMNTMIMSVIERRREIGVLKAVGATNHMVLRQILTESALISLMGGIGGIIIGIVTSFLLGSMARGQIQAVVTPQLALTGLVFALCLGLIGGYYPAIKAARLDPVEALRYE